MFPQYSTQAMIKACSAKAESMDLNNPEKYLPLVSQITFKYTKKYPDIPYEDIFGYGMIGLTNACKRFTGEEPARLAYYKLSIEGEIRHGITTETNYIHQPVNDMQKESSEIISLSTGFDTACEKDDRMIIVEKYLSGNNSLSEVEIAIIQKELKMADVKKSDICKMFSLKASEYSQHLANAINTMKREIIYC